MKPRIASFQSVLEADAIYESRRSSGEGFSWDEFEHVRCRKFHGRFIR